MRVFKWGKKAWGEGGTLPPSPGRRCPEGAEVGSRRGMKRNARQSFHVSASRAAGSAVLPVIPLLTAVLDRERKRFLAFARNDDARRRHTPSFPRKEVLRRGGGWLPKWDERNGAALSVSSSRAQSRDLFRFLFSVQACIIKKNLYMLFLCAP